MKNQILSIGTALTKHEQLKVKGGRFNAEISDGDTCCLSWNHTGFRDCGYSVTEAQWKYNSEWTPATGSHAGQTVTGYCCASCP